MSEHDHEIISTVKPIATRKERREDSLGIYAEERVIQGVIATTPELHEARCHDKPGCECIADGKWCFQRSYLYVVVPDLLWVFIGTPFLECTRDNDGSAAWNALGAADRFFITSNNPNRIDAQILTSSRSIDVRLCCVARYYPAGARLHGAVATAAKS